MTIRVDRSQVGRVVAAAFRLRNTMIDLRRWKHTARAPALFALAQVAVALQYQQTQPIPLRAVAPLMSATALMVSLPANSIPCVRIAEARNSNQRSTATVAARKEWSSCHRQLSSCRTVLSTP